MKLYALTLSPFAARVRLALRIKGVDYEQEAPPGGSTRSPEYLAISPIGKLPVLVTDDGLVIAESETIIDYLEDHYPQPCLIPKDPTARAQIRNAVRTTELYVVPALQRLFAQRDPATRNDVIVTAELAQLRSGLALVSHYVDNATFAAGGVISKADCVVLPTLLLCGIAGYMFGAPEILGEFPKLAGYAAKAQTHADMGAVWAETQAALAALMA
ncbi:glutathione S-transferase family protein [Novosphingobium cyanobacteriorum]|uniref:Glutathione S-transferase family protein n=1 Tax=Novosphingobium cyanobacteriorum TaxID=3024215 RepID=A0ABT6CN19_9SPHN|nr:glutathione S-transferase family protein [Novosphingobium cyanobacteriorum]MDF8334909.1 glutathione S-transferase family protein [Novosphingobium cyanobacteriorum]